MWKTFSRSVWEVFERRAGVTAFRSDSSTYENAETHQQPTQQPRGCRISSLIPRLSPQCLRLFPGCREQAGHNDNEDSKQQQEPGDEKWNEHINQKWFDAVGWSGVFALGWYISQPFGLHRIFDHGRRRKQLQQECKVLSLSKAFLANAQSKLKPIRILPLTASCHPITSSDSITKRTNSVSSSVASSDGIGSTTTEDLEDDDLFTTQRGPFTPKEALDEASRVFEAASRSFAGDVENKLGTHCIERGQHREAMKHFRRGSYLDNAAAAYNLGQCYELGLGTAQNLRKAAKWYKIASDRGHATGMYNLAVFFARGLGGLPEDKIRAHELLTNASALGLQKAKDALNEIQTHTSYMNSVIVEEAKKTSTDALLDMLGVSQSKVEQTQETPKVSLSSLDWLSPTTDEDKYVYSADVPGQPYIDWMTEPALALTIYQLAAHQEQTGVLYTPKISKKPHVMDVMQGMWKMNGQSVPRPVLL